jgi:ABC-type multidrug transport system fused ATPase/permease subunit
LTLCLPTLLCIRAHPQEPFLFSGTVRSNLDPFNSYTEVDLWRAVSSVGLKEAITALEDGMDSHVVDGGNNFSQVRSTHVHTARCRTAIPIVHAGRLGVSTVEPD